VIKEDWLEGKEDENQSKKMRDNEKSKTKPYNYVNNREVFYENNDVNMPKEDLLLLSNLLLHIYDWLLRRSSSFFFLTDDISWSFLGSVYLRVGQSTQLCFITKQYLFLQIAIMFRPKSLLLGENYTVCYKMQVNAHLF